MTPFTIEWRRFSSQGILSQLHGFYTNIISIFYTTRGYFVGRYRVKGNRITVCPNAVIPLYRVLPDRLLTNTHKTLEVIEQSTIQDTHALLPRFGISAGEPYVFHLSRFSERKNPWTILEGFRRFFDLPAPSRPDSPGINATPPVAAPGNETPVHGSTVTATPDLTAPEAATNVGASLVAPLVQ